MIMESPIRKLQKRNDYQRYKLFRKIKRKKKAAREQEQNIAEKELRKKLKLPKFNDANKFYNTEAETYDPANRVQIGDVPEDIISYMPKSRIQFTNDGRFVYPNGEEVSIPLNEVIVSQMMPRDPGEIRQGEEPSTFYKLMNSNPYTEKLYEDWKNDRSVFKALWHSPFSLASAPTRTVLGIQGLTADNGVQKTINDFQNGLYWTGTKSLIGDLGNALMAVEGTGSSLQNAGKFIDRAGVSANRILTQPENTLTRYIGTYDSGYKDMLTHDIIRGNVTPPLLNAAGLAKVRRILKDKVSEEDIRALASNNIRNEEQFNRLNRLMSKTRFGEIASDYNTYLKDKDDLRRITQINALFKTYSKNPEINDWIGNWRISEDKDLALGHPLPTFAKHDELLGNGTQFPGDFAVQIDDANKYGRTATSFGHFASHPTTYRPMSPFEDAVKTFIRKDGLLTGHKYMVEVPKDKMLYDLEQYLKNPNYEVVPTINNIDRPELYRILNKPIPKVTFPQTLQMDQNNSGKDIHIDKNKRGTFTRAAKAHGMGVQEFAHKVLSAPKGKYSSNMRKKANFARNASKFKH